jgi:GNAT superfamily N-acetyltransferase
VSVSTHAVRLAEVAGDGDIETWVGVVDRVDPLVYMTVEQAVHGRAKNPQRLDLLAWSGSRAVGAATVGPSTWVPDADHCHAGIWVEVGSRRQGIGTALFAAVSGRARRLGRHELTFEARDDDSGGLEFLLHRGFRETERELEVELPLEGLEPPDVDLPGGIRLVTRDEQPDVVDGMWVVACEAIPDIPGEETMAARPDWEAVDIHRPDRRPDLCVVALEGDVVVGYGILGDDGRGRASHGLTGVRPAWRRRGIASAIKRRQIGLAIEKGFTTLITANEVRNEPMRRLNEQLGYRPAGAVVMLRGSVPGATG